MSKINLITTYITIGIFFILKYSDTNAQANPKAEGEYVGIRNTYYFSRNKPYNSVRIWNKTNQLSRVPMKYPKGNTVLPNYILIDARMNVGGNPFKNGSRPIRWLKHNELDLT